MSLLMMSMMIRLMLWIMMLMMLLMLMRPLLWPWLVFVSSTYVRANPGLSEFARRAFLGSCGRGDETAEAVSDGGTGEIRGGISSGGSKSLGTGGERSRHLRRRPSLHGGEDEDQGGLRDALARSVDLVSSEQSCLRITDDGYLSLPPSVVLEAPS